MGSGREGRRPPPLPSNAASAGDRCVAGVRGVRGVRVPGVKGGHVSRKPAHQRGADSRHRQNAGAPLRVGLVGALVAVVCLSTTSALAQESSAARPSAEVVLQTAFDKRFNFDVVQIVEIRTRQRSSAISRVLQMASKRIGGRLHGLGYIIAPTRLRDTRLLTVENRDRSDDFFIFLPSEDKVRRITSSRRADSFLGTGLSYEDLERRYVDDYEIADEGVGELEGEPVRLIAARPRYDSGHDIAVYAVAISDYAIREVRYYRGDKKRLLRVQRVSRDALVVMGEHLVPTRIEVEDLSRRSETEVAFTEIHVNPKLDDKLFSRSAIEMGRPIPYLSDSVPAAARKE